MNTQIREEESAVRIPAPQAQADELFRIGGLFDMIKSALPTIGKVAMNVMSTLVGDGKMTVYTVMSEGDCNDGFADSGLHFIGNNGRVIAVNTSLSKTYSVNIPAKGKNPVESISLAPLGKYDITENLRDASNANIQHIGVLGLPNKAAKGLDGIGCGVLSCIAYFVLNELIGGKDISTHISLRAIGKDLRITLSADLCPIQGQSFTIKGSNGGEEKRFNSVVASAVENGIEGAGRCILLKGALDGFKDDDELELLGDIGFENLTGASVASKYSSPLTSDEITKLASSIE